MYCIFQTGIWIFDMTLEVNPIAVNIYAAGHLPPIQSSRPLLPIPRFLLLGLAIW